MRIKLASLYTHKESRSIKTALDLFIESERFQPPRDRHFFRYLFKFRPAFLIQFWKFVWSCPNKLQSKKLYPSVIVWNFLKSCSKSVWNFVVVATLEHAKSKFFMDHCFHRNQEHSTLKCRWRHTAAVLKSTYPPQKAEGHVVDPLLRPPDFAW